MQLQFVPVEEFYFALTLCCRKLEDMGDRTLVERVHSTLAEKLGQSSTVAAGQQTSFNYTFKVEGIDNTPSSQLIVSISDWQDLIRISSDYGWTLNSERKPIRTDKFESRSQFCGELKQHLNHNFDLSLPV